jgi:LmbE family N-acetylglucosaminyl deacetylase
VPDTLHPMPEDWDRALAIAAHPDDLEYGAGGALVRWADAGRELHSLYVTSGEAGIEGMPPAVAGPTRQEEQRRSAARVGIASTEFLDHPDGRVEGGVGLRRQLADAIRRHRPELVITVNHHEYSMLGGWNSSDHRIVGHAVLDAVADAANSWIFPAPSTWRPRWAAVAGSPRATHAVDVSAHLDKAAAALAEHRAYLAALGPAPAEEQAAAVLRKLTAFAAPRFGGRPCVPFELLPG